MPASGQTPRRPDQPAAVTAANPDVLRLPTQAIRAAAARFPTPFFLYEEERIRKNCRDLKRAFSTRFEGFTPLFAVKANPNPHILRIVLDEGFGLDCSSLSEAWLASRFDAFGMHTGNYTTPEEVRFVVGSSRLLLNLDDVGALDRLVAIGVPDFLSFRINPGLTSATLESNLLSGERAKFGLPHERAAEAYRRALDLGVKRFGIHMMTGSNVTEEGYFAEVVARLLAIVAEIRRAVPITFEYVNIGGGFNVPYHPSEPTFDVERIAGQIREAVDEAASIEQSAEPKLMIEPGRRVTADAGFLVSRVVAVKESYKKFVGLDASSSDMPRPFIYDAYHHLSVLGRDGAETEVVTVVGSICENNDRFGEDRLLPRVEVGDLVVVHTCGAHAFAMGHNYNGKLRHAEYLLESGGSFRQIRREETTEDLFRTVIDPPVGDRPPGEPRLGASRKRAARRPPSKDGCKGTLGDGSGAVDVVGIHGAAGVELRLRLHEGVAVGGRRRWRRIHRIVGLARDAEAQRPTPPPARELHVAVGEPGLFLVVQQVDELAVDHHVQRRRSAGVGGRIDAERLKRDNQGVASLQRVEIERVREMARPWVSGTVGRHRFGADVDVQLVEPPVVPGVHLHEQQVPSLGKADLTRVNVLATVESHGTWETVRAPIGRAFVLRDECRREQKTEDCDEEKMLSGHGAPS
jgi:diaminopimelate decarboxylase